MGREKELDQILQLYQHSWEGQASAILITGESGIGKTALLLEAKRRLRRSGALVLEARCQPGRPSYAPAADLLRQAFQHQLEAKDRQRFSAGRMLLDLLERRLDLGASGPGVAQQLAVFDQAAALLESLSQQQPVVLLVHDLDLADAASKRLLSFLSRALAPHPHLGAKHSFRGLLLATAEDAAITRTLLTAETNAVCLELSGLDAEGLRALLATDEIVQQFLAATAGKPQRLFQLARQPLPPAPSAIEAAPASAEQTVLALLAVLSCPATLETLVAVTGLPRSQTQAALSRLILQDVLQEAYTDSALCCGFSRAGELRLTYESLSLEERRRWHQRLARHLQQQGADVELVANHLLAGCCGAEAVEAALAAGTKLEAALGLERAAELYEAALAQDTGAVERAAELHQRLCALYERLDQPERSLAHAQALSAAAPADPETALRLAHLHLLRGSYREASLQLQQAEERAAEAPGHDGQQLRARILSAKAEVLHLCGDLDSAFSAAGNGLLLCSSELEHASTEEATTRITLQNTLAKVHLDRQEVDRALQLIRSNLALARAAKLPVYQTRALIQLGLTHTRRGEVCEAERYYLQAKDLAATVDEVRLQGICLQHLAVLAEHKGAFAASLDFYQQAVAVFKKLGHRSFLSWVGLDLGKLYLRLGDLARGKAMLELAGRLAPEVVPAATRVNHEQLAGRIARAEGRYQLAGQHFCSALEDARRAGHRERQAGLILDQVELALEQEDHGQAQQLLAQDPRDCQTPYSQLRRLHLEARLACKLEPSSALRPRLAATLERAESLQDAETAWQARLGLSLLARSEGRLHEARRLLSEAVAQEQLTAAGLPADLRAQLEEQPARCQLRQLADELGIAREESSLAAGPAAVSCCSMPLRPPLPSSFDEIVGSHSRMQQIYSQIGRVGPSEATVLIRGESGTGKELVAEALHRHSGRSRKPLVKVNCGALVESLLLSELFGHERGAFTGALQRKKGRFELAEGGTIFLDEIGDVSAKTQVALLRVLQEREFERVGGQQPIRIDVRIICATNRDLEEMVTRGEFREDLYYRLQGVRLDVPPLRERLDDLPLLIAHFLTAQAKERNGQVKRLTTAAAELLRRHSWPGNVRELANTLHSTSLLADSDWLDVADFADYPDFKELLCAPAEPPPLAQGQDQPASYAQILEGGISLRALKKQIELECISAALQDSEGNITRAAEILGMKRPRLSQLIKEHGILVS